jgi:hypothetical protein
LGSKPRGVRSVTNLEGVPDGYWAMNDREAINIRSSPDTEAAK